MGGDIISISYLLSVEKSKVQSIPLRDSYRVRHTVMYPGFMAMYYVCIIKVE